MTTLQSIADFHLQGDVSQLSEIRKKLESLYSLGGSLDPIANDTFDAVDLLSKVDISNYTPNGNAQYPQTEYGTALKQVAQIAKADIGLEVACVDIGGWDTHSAEGATDGDMPKLLDELSSRVGRALYGYGRPRQENDDGYDVRVWKARAGKRFRRYRSWARQLHVCRWWRRQRRQSVQ